MLEPLLLGLSSGTVCLAYCAPVLVPYLLGEGRDIKHNIPLLAEFLGGRLAGYVLFALAAWLIGFGVLPSGKWRGLVFGLTYLVLSLLLVAYGFLNLRSWCAARTVPGFLRRFPSLGNKSLGSRPSATSLESRSSGTSPVSQASTISLENKSANASPRKKSPDCSGRKEPPEASAMFLPLTLGLLTGINICPPFLIALTRAAGAGSALDSVRFFIFFFLGTAVYFVPMPLLGVFRFARTLQTVGRLAAGIIGVYYFYIGLVTLYGGLKLL